MTVKRLSMLQWAGLLAGAFAWAAAHVFGYGVTLAECNVGSGRWGIANDPVEAALLGVAAVCALAAGAASIVVLRETRSTSYEDDPPTSRIRFFAIAAVVANVIFVVILLLDLVANLAAAVCRQA
jgi:hypothetical protein